MYRIWKFGLVALVALLVSGATAAPAEAQQGRGLGERLGQQLDEGLDRLSSEVRQGWQSLRRSVDRMGIQGRVYSRLRWDKGIATSRIDVDVPEEGAVVLRGAVRSAAAKEKALKLAEDTVGVERIVDELTIEAETPDR